MVRLLLNKGAKLDRDFGSVPMAVTLDRREIFAALVRAGAPIGIPLMCSLLPLFHSSTLLRSVFSYLVLNICHQILPMNKGGHLFI